MFSDYRVFLKILTHLFSVFEVLNVPMSRHMFDAQDERRISGNLFDSMYAL